ncbi:hypothetical protein ElyMa_006255000 [Elysia marginata]|uniref:Uncharacterized protein n=1 Tax=Elysia marginata TaxID=1093978 RepID=A0AAV4HCV8_9GAST|nr:hypothetical protein ElyMa_006255000 [Elysia marginata]
MSSLHLFLVEPGGKKSPKSASGWLPCRPAVTRLTTATPNPAERDASRGNLVPGPCPEVSHGERCLAQLALAGSHTGRPTTGHCAR